MILTISGKKNPHVYKHIEHLREKKYFPHPYGPIGNKCTLVLWQWYGAEWVTSHYLSKWWPPPWHNMASLGYNNELSFPLASFQGKSLSFHRHQRVLLWMNSPPVATTTQLSGLLTFSVAWTILHPGSLLRINNPSLWLGLRAAAKGKGREWIDSLAPGRGDSDFKSVISEHMLRIKFTSSCEIALRWMPLMLSQHWFRQWLGAIWHQAITWANIDWDLCHHMVSLCHNELICLRDFHFG